MVELGFVVVLVLAMGGQMVGEGFTLLGEILCYLTPGEILLLFALL